MHMGHHVHCLTVSAQANQRFCNSNARRVSHQNCMQSQVYSVHLLEYLTLPENLKSLFSGREMWQRWRCVPSRLHSPHNNNSLLILHISCTSHPALITGETHLGVRTEGWVVTCDAD